MEIKLPNVEFVYHDEEEVKYCDAQFHFSGSSLFVNFIHSEKKSAALLLDKENLIKFRNSLNAFIESDLQWDEDEA
jgi:hypothetical protein